MTTIAVIGGGITGLSALYSLQKEVRAGGQETDLVLIEADERLGGKIRTVADGDFIMETGADSIVARKANVASFVEELGLEGEVVYNATGISYIYTAEGLKKIPAEAVFGIPASLQSLAESELVSAEGKVEALKDLYTPNEHFTRDDSLGMFLEAFLGTELVQKQIAPVISGVYSGDLHELMIASTFPFLLEYKNQYGSIIRGLSENREKYLGNGNKKFISFKDGMSALINRLEELTGDAVIHKGSKAKAIERCEDRYLITLEDGRTIEADYIILSNSSRQAGELLRNTELEAEFNRLLTKSMISVYLGYDDPDALLPSDGTGFIKSGNSELVCDACTWTSRKWGHTSRSRRLLLRLFYKSSNPEYERLAGMTEAELQNVAVKDVAMSLGIHAEPVSSEVTRWHENMPNYHLQHRQVVEALEQKLAVSHPNVLLAGCSYYGVGIPDCIANGEKTARKIAQQLKDGR